MASWFVIAGPYEIEAPADSLPNQLAEIEAYVRANDNLVPLDQYPASIQYDREKPETVLAAAYAYLKELSGLTPTVFTVGIEMPVWEGEPEKGVLY